MANILEQNLHIKGGLSAESMTIPDGTVNDDAVAANADIAESKVEQRFRPIDAQPNGSANVARRVVVHLVRGLTGSVKTFKARNTTAATGGDSTSVDLLKNGSSILSSPIVLNAAAGTTVQTATLSSSSLAVDDVLEVEYTLSGSTVGNGAMACVDLSEKAL